VHLAVQRRVTRIYPRAPAAVSIPSDDRSLERGRHLVEVVGQCTTCHGPDLSGQELADDLWLGRLWAPNLTPGRGGIAEHSDADLVRSIRYGVKRDGRPVLMMPAQYLYHLSDDDVGAVIAWLRRLPPVNREVPEPRMGPLSELAIVSGRVPDLIPAERVSRQPPRLDAPQPSASPAYGAYLVETGGCKVCHREDLSGGLHPLSLPEEPPPPDLTASGRLASWSEDDFLRALRTGTTPDGQRMDDAWMPWRSISRMSDLELRAIFRFLRSLPGGTSAGI
jgi:mono/diheme cytochrome c family protein